MDETRMRIRLRLSLGVIGHHQHDDRVIYVPSVSGRRAFASRTGTAGERIWLNSPVGLTPVKTKSPNLRGKRCSHRAYARRRREIQRRRQRRYVRWIRVIAGRRRAIAFYRPTCGNDRARRWGVTPTEAFRWVRGSITQKQSDKRREDCQNLRHAFKTASTASRGRCGRQNRTASGSRLREWRAP